jgi:hypothetical protein
MIKFLKTFPWESSRREYSKFLKTTFEWESLIEENIPIGKAQWTRALVCVLDAGAETDSKSGDTCLSSDLVVNTKINIVKSGFIWYVCKLKTIIG